MIIFDEDQKPVVEPVTIEELIEGMGEVAVYSSEQCNQYLDMMYEIKQFVEKTGLPVKGYRQLDVVTRVSFFYEVETR